MMQRPTVITIVLTIWAGLFLTMDFVPATSPVYVGLMGQATLYIKWDLENLFAGFRACLASAEPIGCFSGLLTMFWGVSGVPLRFGIIIVGAATAGAIVYLQKKNP